MATEKKRSKGRFLYLFDWNAKPRKKLFSNKSDSSEGSIQGNESVDNLAISQYLLREVCENGDRSSIRGNGDYNYATFVNEDDGYKTRAPGVVARLMGLDSIPTSSCEPSSVSPYEFQAVENLYYPRKGVSFQPERHDLDYNCTPDKVEPSSPWNSRDSRRNKVHGRPIERFQTEILPPKSAKPISITHHKLLSPIKSPGYVHTKDAAYVMETAARMIDQSPHPTGRIKIPSLGSPSSSFRMQELKERIDAAQRSTRLHESSKTPKNSHTVQQVRGNPSNRSSSRSLFKNIMGSETSSSQKVKNKGKSNAQKREDSVYNDGRSRPEHKNVNLKQKQPTAQKARQTKTSRSKTSGVLRQNNDKQNIGPRKDKSSSETTISDQQRKKIVQGDNYAGRSKIVNKVVMNTENGPKKVVNDKRASHNGVAEKTHSLNRIKNISRNKQFTRRDNRLAECAPENNGEEDGRCNQSCNNDSRVGMDVISFTFTSPIKNSGKSLSSNEASGSNCHRDGDGCYMNNQSRSRSSLSPPSGLSLIDSGSLSFLLEQKLRELTNKIGANQSDPLKEGTEIDSAPCFPESMSSHDVFGSYGEWSNKDQTETVGNDECSSSLITDSSQKWEGVEGAEDNGVGGINKCENGRESDHGHQNFSNPECSVSESCMSSKTTSDFTYEYEQPSSPRSQEVTSCISTESVHQREDETYYTDIASYWQLEYIRHMLHYAGLTSYGLDVDCKLIDPAVFDLLEHLLSTSGKNELCYELERKILFDGVSEIISLRYERVVLGSKKEWGKWGMLLQNDWLTEDTYREILYLQGMGNLMVDELVDRDMSTNYGKWLDFETESLEEGMEIESEIVALLIDEVIADMSI